MRTTRWLGTSAAALSAVAGVALVATVLATDDRDGPLANEERSHVCIPAEAGTPVTFGGVTITNSTDTALVLESAHIGPDSDNVVVGEILIAEIRNRTLVGHVQGWDPPTDAQPVEDVTVPPGEARNLLVRVEAERADQAAYVDGLYVTYLHANRRYTDGGWMTLTVPAAGRRC